MRDELALVDDRQRREAAYVEHLGAEPELGGLVGDALAKHVELALERLDVVHRLLGRRLSAHPLAAADEDLADRGKSLAGDASARHRIVRHRAPSEHALSFFTNDALDHLLAGLALARVARQEDHSDAVLAARRQSEPELVGLLEEKLVRNLHQDSGAVAGVGIASASPAMGQVVEDLDTLVNDVMRRIALDIDHEADAARIVFVRRIVEPLLVGKSSRLRHRHARLV